MPQSEREQVIAGESAGFGWRTLYQVGGTTVLIGLLIPLAEIGISYLPGVARATRETVTVIDCFTLFQNHWFLGLRNLGLLDLIAAALLAPTVLAIDSAIRRDHEAYGAFGPIIFFVGVGGLFLRQQGPPPYAFP
jgi:hypothetical protein